MGHVPSHFFLSFLMAGVLWVRDHKAFRRFMALYVTLMLSGFLTYVLYPAMPPWLASKERLHAGLGADRARRA